MATSERDNTGEQSTGMRSKHHERGEKLLTATEVAERLGMSRGWVRNHARGAYPQITCVKLGSRLRFKEADIEEFVERCRKEAEKRGWAA